MLCHNILQTYVLPTARSLSNSTKLMSCSFTHGLRFIFVDYQQLPHQHPIFTLFQATTTLQTCRCQPRFGGMRDQSGLPSFLVDVCRAEPFASEGSQRSLRGLLARCARVRPAEQSSLSGSQVPGVQSCRHVLWFPGPRGCHRHDAGQVSHHSVSS